MNQCPARCVWIRILEEHDAHSPSQRTLRYSEHGRSPISGNSSPRRDHHVATANLVDCSVRVTLLHRIFGCGREGPNETRRREKDRFTGL